jgi:hypothetical protein
MHRLEGFDCLFDALQTSSHVSPSVTIASRNEVRLWKKLLVERVGGNRSSETRRFGQVSWEEITSAIEQEWRQPSAELRESRGNSARATAIWFALHLGGMSLEQVRAELGAGSYRAVAMQVGRFQRKLPQSSELRKRL